VHISLMLAVQDAPAAVDWYKRALGATELWNLGGVAGLSIAGAPAWWPWAAGSFLVPERGDLRGAGLFVGVLLVEGGGSRAGGGDGRCRQVAGKA
jgi:hypothetical protein